MPESRGSFSAGKSCDSAARRRAVLVSRPQDPAVRDFTSDPPGTDVGTLDMAYDPPAVSPLTLRRHPPTSAPHPEPLGSNCVADQRDLLGRVRAGVFRGGRDRCTAFVRSSAASATTRSVAVEMRDHRVKLPRVAIQATRPKARATA
jgi:hypothetical protein